MTSHNRVVIETGKKKVFASAIDWPGWSRPAKTEEEALAALKAYAERYQRVAGLAGISGVPAAAESFEVVDRLRGNATTDFGAPDKAADCESEQMTEAECERQISMLRACWQVFDETAEQVSEELQKGPRGGGRNRSIIIEHTFEAERSYARKIGVLTPKGAMNTPAGLEEHRDAICEAIRERNASEGTDEKWPLWYFVRRAAWHVMDHAWEMEDKDLTGKTS
jgi:hypothetical protein